MHSAGNMEKNLLAVEVKPGIARSCDMKKDIETLISCLNKANYEYGMLLIYGGRRPQWLGKLERFAGSHTKFPDFRNRLLGACPTLTFLLRRARCGHLRRSRPEKILNVFQ